MDYLLTSLLLTLFTITYSGHSTRGVGVWDAKDGIQISRNELHTHIHLDYVRVEFLFCIKKNYNKLPQEL